MIWSEAISRDAGEAEDAGSRLPQARPLARRHADPAPDRSLRRRILTDVLDTPDDAGGLRYNLALLGRAKKNAKTERAETAAKPKAAPKKVRTAPAAKAAPTARHPHGRVKAAHGSKADLVG